METITIEIPDGKRAEWINGVLTLVDDKPKDIKERIKTFEDAYNELGKEHPYCKAWDSIGGEDDDCEDIKDILAYHKLRIICAALNEGWKFSEERSEKPCFVDVELYTHIPLNEQNTSHKVYDCYTEELIYAQVQACGYYNAHRYMPLVLIYKNKEIAKYAGNQFFDIYKDFLF